MRALENQPHRLEMKRKHESERWGGGIPEAELGVASRLTALQPQIGGRNGREQVWKDRWGSF